MIGVDQDHLEFLCKLSREGKGADARLLLVGIGSATRFAKATRRPSR